MQYADCWPGTQVRALTASFFFPASAFLTVFGLTPGLGGLPVSTDSRVLVMGAGRFVTEGPVPDILADPAKLEVWGFDIIKIRQDSKKGEPVFHLSLKGPG